jgi:hypothetical protein
VCLILPERFSWFSRNLFKKIAGGRSTASSG